MRRTVPSLDKSGPGSTFTPPVGNTGDTDGIGIVSRGESGTSVGVPVSAIIGETVGVAVSGTPGSRNNCRKSPSGLVSATESGTNSGIHESPKSSGTLRHGFPHGLHGRNQRWSVGSHCSTDGSLHIHYRCYQGWQHGYITKNLGEV